jgi:hypothetical protein
MYDRGNVPAQIEQRVHLDGAVLQPRPKRRPGKQRETEANGGGIERVDRGVDERGEFGLWPEGGIDIERPNLGDKLVGEVVIDTPVAVLVGVGALGSLVAQGSVSSAQAPEARWELLTYVQASLGHGAKAPSTERRGRGGWVAGYGNAPAVLSAVRSGHSPYCGRVRAAPASSTRVAAQVSK